MEDLISRQDAIDVINKALDRETLLNRFTRKIAVDAVKKLPSAQPERKRGRWTEIGKDMYISLENAREQYKCLGYLHRNELKIQCSECRMITIVDESIAYEFCPHCGAVMEYQE